MALFSRKKIKIRMMRWLDQWIAARPSTPVDFQDKIAILKLGGMGDCLIARGYIDSLVKNAGQTPETTYIIASQSVKFLEWLFPSYTIFHVCEKSYQRNPFYHFKIARALRHLNIKQIFCSMTYFKPDCVGSLMRVSAAPTICLQPANAHLAPSWAYYQNQLAQNQSRIFPMLTNLLDRPLAPEDRYPHELEQIQYLSQNAFGANIVIDWTALPIVFSPEPKGDGRYVVINLAASNDRRTVPLAFNLNIAERLAEKGIPTFLVAATLSPALYKQLSLWHQSHTLRDLIHVRIGSYSIPQYWGLIKNAAAYFGTDTGPTHAAYLYGTPTIVMLFHVDEKMSGATPYGSYFPYPDGAVPTPYLEIRAKEDVLKNVQNPLNEALIATSLDNIINLMKTSEKP